MLVYIHKLCISLALSAELLTASNFLFLPFLLYFVHYHSVGPHLSSPLLSLELLNTVLYRIENSLSLVLLLRIFPNVLVLADKGVTKDLPRERAGGRFEKDPFTVAVIAFFESASASANGCLLVWWMLTLYWTENAASVSSHHQSIKIQLSTVEQASSFLRGRQRAPISSSITARRCA